MKQEQNDHVNRMEDTKTVKTATDAKARGRRSIGRLKQRHRDDLT